MLELAKNSQSRYLPHWESPQGIYFVTFRLADSLPKAQLNKFRWELEAANQVASRDPEKARPLKRDIQRWRLAGVPSRPNSMSRHRHPEPAWQRVAGSTSPPRSAAGVFVGLEYNPGHHGEARS
jgi:hypothetical protein